MYCVELMLCSCVTMLLQVFDLMIVDKTISDYGFKVFDGLTILTRASNKVHKEHR